MKKNRNDKNISKSESRFKSKFEFLKKLPHSVLSNSAVEKARAFFRSSELKHHDSSNSNEQSSSPSSSSSSNQQHTTVNTHCSSFNSTDINENTENNNTSLDLVTPKIYFSTSNMIKVDKINSKDMMNYQIIHNDQNDYKLSSKQCQNKYKQYLKPSLLIPKQYYNEILNNKQNQYYFTSVNKYDSCPRSSASTLSRNSTYSTRLHSPYNYLTPCNEASSYDQLPISLYNYRSNARREIKSSLDEPYIRPSSSIIQPLPSSSSSSMLTWNQCVRRLNTEYKLTIIALQQTKERLEQIYLNPKKSISKYANLVAHDIKNLSNNERKKPTNVTFCLPSSSSSSSSSSLSSITKNFSSSSISIRQIEKNKNFPSAFLSKPKFIKPVELNTFFSSSSSSKLEPVLAIVESNEKLDSINTIIRKFNDLNGSLSVTKIESSTIIPNDSTTNLDVYIKPSIINNDLKEISDQSLLPSSSKSILINENHQLENSLHEEETTYTIKTFYQSINTNENNSSSSSNRQHVVIVEENTTEEKFNLACEKQHQEIETNCTSPQHIVTIDESKFPSSYINSSLNENFPSIETSSNCVINNTSSSSDTSSTLSNSHNKTRTSFIPLKNNNNNNKPILQTSKRPTTTTKANTSHLGQSSKIIVSSTRLKPPSSKFINSTNTSIIRKPTKNTTNKIQSQSSSITKQQSSINSNQINEFQNKTNSTSSIDKNRVKSIVNQINANTSSHSIVPSSKTNKRTHCSVSNQLTTSTSKNTIQRK